jgi:hypothetical protein
MVALRMCLDRLVPPRRERPVNFTLPEINSADNATKAMAAIIKAVANDELTPTEAAVHKQLTRDLNEFLSSTEIHQRAGRT